MTVTYQGQISLGQAVPLALQSGTLLTTTLGAQLPDIAPRLDGLLALQAAPPPSLLDLVASVQNALAALQNLVAAPLPDVGATTDAIDDLQARMADLQAGIAFGDLLLGLLGTAGIYAYLFEGRSSELGQQMSAELSAGLPGGGGPGETIAGTILLARDGGAIEALRTVLLSAP